MLLSLELLKLLKEICLKKRLSNTLPILFHAFKVSNARYINIYISILFSRDGDDDGGGGSGDLDDVFLFSEGQ